MRYYRHIDRYLNSLLQDIYPQPADPGHTAWAVDVIHEFCFGSFAEMPPKNVLDVGCGEGFCSDTFTALGMDYTGITIGESDLDVGMAEGRNVHEGLATFLPYPDDYFDLIFARHILEHSPMPLLTLMEWRRVSRKYMILVMPAWEYWQIGGKNHYSMLDKDRLWYLLSRAGWAIMKQTDFTTSDAKFMEFFRLSSPPEDRNYIGSPKIVEYRYACEVAEEKME